MWGKIKYAHTCIHISLEVADAQSFNFYGFPNSQVTNHYCIKEMLIDKEIQTSRTICVLLASRQAVLTH